ncbi:SDR family oxidoreductase [Alicycliphilus denitrificans]|uniref:3-oxoacyl-(Acyl-carrier-protein) reductase n=2 Tax=Alicycliphilus denitrificans TaxID=179636 RepID=F4GDD1_ALIDK|nr:SDR family NAD(P)-dependent oxidoreductase [Alicycliphilus denitrificans]ADU99057.1 short-chain dehydrogenase/reductase SDR [Alicycliphilus denitrificans BC]AEB85960.1 3-oxoacyl-(acyl-carrier-protein) reductase [Alicycliphilus denitrificans K601]QKD43357.1 SDR family oxidoreductase [Alicycliphilus denitrificans]
MTDEEADVLDLTGKVALVMGCGAVADGWGNGRATAVLLARQGARVFGTDLALPHAQETARLVRSEGGTCEVMACDATRSDQVADAVAQCVERFGRIDILVNNVGVSQPGGPVDMDEDVWDAQIQVNLKSAYLSCKHVIAHMRSQGGGAIVNVASVAGLRYIGKPQVAYAAAKAGLLHFTHTTAVIHAAEGIRLNCVVPGLMHTPLIEGLAAKYAKGDTQGFIDHRNNQVPMKRMGTGWDTAHAVLFLVADESRYVTGTEIVVDGGLIAATR